MKKHKKLYQLQVRSCQESNKAEAVHVGGEEGRFMKLPKFSSFSNKINTRTFAAVFAYFEPTNYQNHLIELNETPSLREMEAAWFITTQTA